MLRISASLESADAAPSIAHSNLMMGGPSGRPNRGPNRRRFARALSRSCVPDPSLQTTTPVGRVPWPARRRATLRYSPGAESWLRKLRIEHLSAHRQAARPPRAAQRSVVEACPYHRRDRPTVGGPRSVGRSKPPCSGGRWSAATGRYAVGQQWQRGPFGTGRFRVAYSSPASSGRASRWA